MAFHSSQSFATQHLMLWIQFCYWNTPTNLHVTVLYRSLGNFIDEHPSDLISKRWLTPHPPWWFQPLKRQDPRRVSCISLLTWYPPDHLPRLTYNLFPRMSLSSFSFIFFNQAMISVLLYSVIVPSKKVRNLCVILDEDLTFSSQARSPEHDPQH